MITHFQYHALAIGFSGEIFRPFREVIPVQASSALPAHGGFGSSRVDRFNFREMISFASAYSVVAGSYDEKHGAWDTLATSVVEGLDILGVVTVERIVARIATSHPADGSEPSITPAGSCFEGLRIAGHQPQLDLVTGTFADLATHSSVRKAYRDDKDFREQFHAVSLLDRVGGIPERLQPYFPASEGGPKDEIPERNGVIARSLVGGIEGVGRECACFGHAIHIKGFGVIRLAELQIAKQSRRLSMLQVDLGSTPGAGVAGGTVEGNGSGW